jgi:hypothetical protein
MKLSIEADRKINTLIPSLLKQSKTMSKELKTRIKANSIFKEFEKKAQNEFNFYINDSNKRYINAKRGHDIDQYIDESEPKYKDKLKRIMSDKFYTELNLKPEKEKMKKKSTRKIYANIKEIFTNIRGNLGTGKSVPNIFNYKTKITTDNPVKQKKLKINKLSLINDLSVFKKAHDDKILFLNKNKKEINNIFNFEQKSISNSIDKYKINLSKIKIPSPNEEIPENKKLTIDLPLIRMLYYQHYKPKPKIEDDDIEKVNINKLLPYSKYGRYLLKQRSEKHVIKSQDFPYFMTETVNRKNYGSTNDMVISSAKKNIILKNSYSFRRNRMKELLDIKIPNINEYDNIIKNKIQNIKESRNKKKKEISKIQSLNFLSKNDLFNFKIKQSIELLNLKEKQYSK